MSLNYDLTAIDNSDEVCWTGQPGERTMQPVTETLIWATMLVGISQITEKNYREFYLRDKMLYLDSTLTVADCKRHIGLKTNATDKTRAKFNGTLVSIYRERAERAARESES